MTDNPGAITTTFRVGRKYRCTWTWRAQNIGGTNITHAEWEPDVPNPSKFTKSMWRDYERGRKQFFDAVADQLGGSVACFSPDGKIQCVSKPEAGREDD